MMKEKAIYKMKKHPRHTGQKVYQENTDKAVLKP